MSPPPLASVDQVRDELKRLGYLESGLDRFVLGGAGSPSALRASAAVALRVGILGGVLLGVALTLGAAALLGRFGSLAGVAVLSAGGVGGRLPAASLSRRHMLPLLGVAAVLLGGGVAAASYLAGALDADTPDFAVVPTGLRVRVVGI